MIFREIHGKVINMGLRVWRIKDNFARIVTMGIFRTKYSMNGGCVENDQ